MKDTDRRRVLQKLEEMENYVHEIKELLPSREVYSSDLKSKRACEKTIELAIESLIDVASMLISYERLGTPEDEDSIFEILDKKKVITKNLKKRLTTMKGFRNIIVHRYGEIDDDLVYDFLENELKDFEDFVSQITKFIRDK
ncbi:MAG: type VII toxin-antitoxin system HepT family RNase toxin [Candidatus Woesearchaeota archaeon]